MGKRELLYAGKAKKLFLTDNTILNTSKKMDRDRFRQGLGGLNVAYQQV